MRWDEESGELLVYYWVVASGWVGGWDVYSDLSLGFAGFAGLVGRDLD